MSPIQWISIFCAVIPGLVFLATGLLKALSPTPFYLYMDRLQLVEFGYLRFIIGGGALLQCVLGTGLILRLYPAIVFPAALLLLAAFATFTLWAWLAKGVDDCGCYGGILAVSPRKSLLLDVLYAALISFSWYEPAAFPWSPATEWALFFEPGLVFASTIFMTSWVFRKWGQDMVLLTPIKQGRVWNPDWLEGYDQITPGDDRLIVFMSPTCAFCKDWTKPLNKISQRADMPQVIAGMGGDAATVARYAAENGVEFPILLVKDSTMDRLIRSFPTVVEVRGGRISARGEAALPAHLLQQLKSSQREFAGIAQQVLGRYSAANAASGS